MFNLPRLLVALILLFSSNANAEYRTIKLAADYWCPYTCDINDEKQGFFLEIAKEVLKKENIQIEYVFTSWHEAIKMAESGEVDGVMGSTINEAPKLKYLDLPLVKTQVSAYTRSDANWQPDNLDSLSCKNMCLVLGHTPYGPVKEYVLNNYLTSPESFTLPEGRYASKHCVKMLMDYETEVIYESEEVVPYILKNMNIRPESLKNAKLMDVDDLYIALSPKFKDFALINQLFTYSFLDPMLKVRYQEILEKYGLQDLGYE